MSLVDAHISMTLRYELFGIKCENVFMYFTEGAVFLGVNAVQVAEAWWRDIEGDLRAMAATSLGGSVFKSVICRNLVAAGELGEYAIALDQQQGTRDPGLAAQILPPFNAVGFRLAVGNTSTRPGQKRLPFLLNTDVQENDLQPAILALAETFAAHIDGPLTLGEPVALGVLQPIVGGTIVGDFPTVYQDVVGHVLNTHVTSQVSRKLGHGS